MYLKGFSAVFSSSNRLTCYSGFSEVYAFHNIIERVGVRGDLKDHIVSHPQRCLALVLSTFQQVLLCSRKYISVV